MLYYRYILLLFLMSCASNNRLIFVQKNNISLSLNQDFKKTWHHKDIILDSIPGISLDRAYQGLLKNKKGKEVIVAILDTQLDINHEDLKDNIWMNKNEIPNNQIDDDENGYIDDINGWNFIGNSKGESLLKSNFEIVRIVKHYRNYFEDKNISNLNISDMQIFKIYNVAKHKLKNEIKANGQILTVFKEYLSKSDSAKKVLHSYFPNNNYSINKLKLIKTNNKEIKSHISNLLFNMENNLTDEFLKNQIKKGEKNTKFYFNINYNFDDRISNDNPDDINNIKYGFNNVATSDTLFFDHSTLVSGLICANRKNSKGIKGISNNISIMPIVISAIGDEHDKDISLAIRYAVDNGADIINMSSSKEISLYETWVQEAIKYAETNNVLFITSAGNDSLNLDQTINYPNDKNIDVNNFISVGATSHFTDKKIIFEYSNYGKQNVDIFAPGEEIYTTKVNNLYGYDSGTSLSTPIVSGVAALILSYYPKLRAHQVKEILLASGVSYDIDIEITDENGKKKLVPFSSLSKSGKIVNAYNALLYAKNYKKWKAGKWPR